MRWAALIAIAVGCGSAAGACAQSAATQSAAVARQLKDAAFAARTEGAVAWQSGEVRLSPADNDDGAVVSLRIKVGQALRPPVGPLLSGERKDFDVTVVRSWPKAVSVEAEAFDLAIAPHAGLGVSSRGGQAEGGAMITVSPKSRGEQAMARLRDMGVKDGASFGNAGRWYLFAAASGQAVGLNMTHDEHGWDRAGWSTDATSGLVGDAQVGVGWRKGDGQASLGVIHREVKGRHMIFGQTTRDDTMAAFSFSIRPGR